MYSYQGYSTRMIKYEGKAVQCSDGRVGKPGKPAGLPKINWEAPTNYDITL